MTHLRAFSVNYYPATNTKGAKIRIKDERSYKTIFLSYDYDIGDMETQTVKHLKSLHITVFSKASVKTGVILLSKNFDTLL